MNYIVILGGCSIRFPVTLMRECSKPAAEVPGIEDQRQFWNDWDARFREDAPLDEVSRRRGLVVLEWLQSLRLAAPRILEVGCANGWFSEKLAEFGSVTAVDLADEVIARAKLRCPHIDFKAADILTSDLGEATFDVVVSLETISYVPDQPRFVEALARALRPQGYVILTSLNRFVFERLDGVAPKAPGQVRKWLNKRELRQLLGCRLRILRLETIAPAGHRGVLRLINSHKLNKFFGWLASPEKIDRCKEKAGLGQTIIVLAQNGC